MIPADKWDSRNRKARGVVESASGWEVPQMNTARIMESRPLRNGWQSRASERPSTPTDVFKVRAEARAVLFSAGELNLHEAVDALQAAAIASGLLGEIGQDAVQAIIAQAFASVRS